MGVLDNKSIVKVCFKLQNAFRMTLISNSTSQWLVLILFQALSSPFQTTGPYQLYSTSAVHVQYLRAGAVQFSTNGCGF